MRQSVNLINMIMIFKNQRDLFMPTFLSNQTENDRNKCCTKSFPSRLQELLADAEKNGYNDIISWQPHGRAFRIHKPKLFSVDIMPMIFRQTKWSSFQRQLNRYGFTRILDGPDKGGYYHESFVRGKPDLLMYVVCTPVKGTKKRTRGNPKTIPNFYRAAKSVEGDTRAGVMPREHTPSKVTSSVLVSSMPLISTPTCVTPGSLNAICSTVTVRTLSNDLNGKVEVNDDDLHDLWSSMFGTSTIKSQASKGITSSMENFTAVSKDGTSVSAVVDFDMMVTDDASCSSINCNDKEWESFMESAFD